MNQINGELSGWTVFPAFSPLPLVFFHEPPVPRSSDCVTLPDNRKNQQVPSNRFHHPVAVRREKGYCIRLDLTPDSLDHFITGLLDHLRNHLHDADDVSDRQTIIHEARQYLRGANALCASAAIGEWPQQGDYSGTDGMAGLLNHMFEEGHARMDEIADEALSVCGWKGRSADELQHTGH